MQLNNKIHVFLLQKKAYLTSYNDTIFPRALLSLDELFCFNEFRLTRMTIHGIVPKLFGLFVSAHTNGTSYRIAVERQYSIQFIGMTPKKWEEEEKKYWNSSSNILWIFVCLYALYTFTFVKSSFRPLSFGRDSKFIQLHFVFSVYTAHRNFSVFVLSRERERDNPWNFYAYFQCLTFSMPVILKWIWKYKR